MVVLLVGGREWGWVCVGEGVFAGAKGVCLRQCVWRGEVEGMRMVICRKEDFLLLSQCARRDKKYG